MDKTFPLPSFKKPPVDEVACSVAFKRLDGFRSPHVGNFWASIQSDFPTFEEKSWLRSMIEGGSGPSDPTPNLEVSEIPPLPRVWFISLDERMVIQIQRDRFVFNWRKREPNDIYPRFRFVYEHFVNSFNNFRDFLAMQDIGEIDPIQYELTYINHIPNHAGWETFGDIGRVLPDFSWRKNIERFLPEPESLVWSTSFRPPHQPGRLHVTVRKATRLADNVDIIRIELVARGIQDEPVLDTMKEWFESARRSIVCGFADLTSTEVQEKEWERTE